MILADGLVKIDCSIQLYADDAKLCISFTVEECPPSTCSLFKL